MKYIFLAFVSLFPLSVHAYEEELLYENSKVGVYKWKLMPHDSVGQHRDLNPEILIAIQGGTVTRLGEDGSTSEITLPTNKAIYQEPDLELHDGINNTNAPIEAIMIELKE